MIKLFSKINLILRATLLLSCFFVSGCENDPRAIKELTENKRAVIEVKGVETYFSQNGNLKSRLTAPVLYRYESDTVLDEFTKGLHVNFFDSLGKPESHLDALYGKYFENQNRIYLRDSVFVYNIKGDTLWSPELWWDQNTQKFYTDKKVRIHRNGDRIYGGKGLIANQDLSDIHIKEINGTLSVPDSIGGH